MPLIPFGEYRPDVTDCDQSRRGAQRAAARRRLRADAVRHDTALLKEALPQVLLHALDAVGSVL